MTLWSPRIVRFNSTQLWTVQMNTELTLAGEKEVYPSFSVASMEISVWLKDFSH